MLVQPLKLKKKIQIKVILKKKLKNNIVNADKLIENKFWIPTRKWVLFNWEKDYTIHNSY